MDNRYPVAVIVPRNGKGDIRIVWQEGTDEDFLRVLRPLVAMGEAVMEAMKRNASEAGGAAPDAGGRAQPDGESIDPDSL